MIAQGIQYMLSAFASNSAPSEISMTMRIDPPHFEPFFDCRIKLVNPCMSMRPDLHARQQLEALVAVTGDVRLSVISSVEWEVVEDRRHTNRMVDRFDILHFMAFRLHRDYTAHALVRATTDNALHLPGVRAHMNDIIDLVKSNFPEA